MEASILAWGKERGGRKEVRVDIRVYIIETVKNPGECLCIIAHIIYIPPRQYIAWMHAETKA